MRFIAICTIFVVVLTSAIHGIEDDVKRALPTMTSPKIKKAAVRLLDIINRKLLPASVQGVQSGLRGSLGGGRGRGGGLGDAPGGSADFGGVH
jgi:hypothetical protein